MFNNALCGLSHYQMKIEWYECPIHLSAKARLNACRSQLRCVTCEKVCFILAYEKVRQTLWIKSVHNNSIWIIWLDIFSVWFSKIKNSKLNVQSMEYNSDIKLRISTLSGSKSNYDFHHHKIKYSKIWKLILPLDEWLLDGVE